MNLEVLSHMDETRVRVVRRRENGEEGEGKKEKRSGKMKNPG